MYLTPSSRTRLHSWVHYERLLKEAVVFNRYGSGRVGSRVPVGEAFMTTHSFAVERLESDYATRVRKYTRGNETLLAMCRNTVRLVTFRRFGAHNTVS